MTACSPALAGEICFYMERDARSSVIEKSHSLINVLDDLSIKGKLIPNFETNY